MPLTQPIDGWNYWKYGQTYYSNLTDSKNGYFQTLGGKVSLVNNSSIEKIHKGFSKWSSVEEYYNRISYSNSENLPALTLFKYLHDGVTKIKSANQLDKYVGLINTVTDYSEYPDFKSLTNLIAVNICSVIYSHSNQTYESIISYYGDDYFERFYYLDYLEANAQISYSVKSVSLDDLIPDSRETSILANFANEGENLSILNWDLEDPATWEGITWNSDGNVESIDLPYLNLTGTLNLTDFSALTSVDISGNEISSLVLDGCTYLEELDCSFNQLTELNISDCASLTSLTCCYNYLDTHEGGTLYSTLDDLMFSDCYVNYYPQAVPENATFNATELSALKTFANTDNNNSVLDWLDESGNIDTDKLQNNVLFEYDGSNYRVVAIDIAESEVSGTLNLTSLSSLEEIYCEDNCA
jgi:hypothetical protein